jgi:uncharacterized protein YecE (DUF72 family)
MTSLHISCLGLAARQAAYWAKFTSLELPDDAVESMTKKTLARWRRQAPEGADFVPFVSPGVAAAGFTGAAAETAWAKTREVAEILRADTVILRTPARFRPTAANRARFEAFWRARLPDGMVLAWWAEGLWDSQTEDRDALCAALGMIPVVDPLALDDDESLPSGARFYWRLRGTRGLQAGFSDYQLDRLVEWVEPRERGHIVFTDVAMRRDAQSLASTWRMMQGEPLT